MKKSILLFLLSFALCAYAQNNTTVAVNESTAEVLLLSGYTMTVQITGMYNDHITYIQGGQSYSLPAEQINKVTFLLNGQVKQYAQIPQYTPTTQTKTLTQEVVVNKQEKEKEKTKVDGRIYILNGDYMCNNVFISSKELERLIQSNTKAHKQWRKGRAYIWGGSICLGVGLGLAIGGFIPIKYKYYDSAIALECVALASACASIGLYCAVPKAYQKAIDIYNSKFDHAAVQFKYNIAPNGFSVALAF